MILFSLMVCYTLQVYYSLQYLADPQLDIKRAAPPPSHFASHKAPFRWSEPQAAHPGGWQHGGIYMEIHGSPSAA